jgi:thiamine-phosphate diphosphorylase
VRPLPRLFAFTDARVRTLPRLRQTAHVIASVGPAVALVARDPGAGGAALTDLTTLFVAEARPLEAAVFVAGRPDLAAALRLPGLHLRAGDLSIPDARRLVPHAWIGRAVHSATEGAEAVEEGADFLVAGSIFETASHPGRPAMGLAFLETIASLGRPVIAIGGVTPERARRVKDAGAYGVAAITALWNAARPAAVALEMLEPWA